MSRLEDAKYKDEAFEMQKKIIRVGAALMWVVMGFLIAVVIAVLVLYFLR